MNIFIRFIHLKQRTSFCGDSGIVILILKLLQSNTRGKRTFKKRNGLFLFFGITQKIIKIISFIIKENIIKMRKRIIFKMKLKQWIDSEMHRCQKYHQKRLI